ncbi:hypothetical protein G7Y89_g11947 [Cudoniella acicularis]|uniref:Enoyl reductase (ER) domain-containing protein n=1 Tax=Cudoniella acicularis TaxID=354080 RepID=A0A8H4VXI4_9HELO|nr:hypothetical protein G7Y89_g11947 [Cudoniella acicularis]
MLCLSLNQSGHISDMKNLFKTVVFPTDLNIPTRNTTPTFRVICKVAFKMATMKAWQYKAIHGGLEKSIELNTSTPSPPSATLSKGQFLIQVITSAINPVDYKIPELGFPAKFIVGFPAIPGQDFCGRVVGASSSDDVFKVGDVVFGTLGKPTQVGTLSEYTVASSEGSAHLPNGVDPDQAAAVGTAGLTAFQCLPKDIVKPGCKVFINGGSGGTGTWGIQFARILGAEVTTSCSTHNVELCKSLGPVFDLVVDNVGSPGLYEHGAEFIKPGGSYFQIGTPASVAGAVTIVKRLFLPRYLGGGERPFRFISFASKHDDLVEIGKWLSEGKARAVIDEAFEFENVPKAFEKLKTGHATGKIIVHVDQK